MASDERARILVNALQEENRADDSAEQLEGFFSQVGQLETKYKNMLKELQKQGTTVIRHTVNDPSDLIADFESRGVRLRIIGPSRKHLDECRRLLKDTEGDSFSMMSNLFGFGEEPSLVDTYRKLANGPGAFFAASFNKGAINLQSIITLFEYNSQKVLLAGDFQFALPEVSSNLLKESVRAIREEISAEAPFYYYKLSHHASYNGFSEDIFQEIRGTEHLGINGGTDDRSHPDKDVLKVLKSHRNEVKWVRTDQNGQSSISLEDGQTDIHVSRGKVNDWQPNTGGGGMGFSMGEPRVGTTQRPAMSRTQTGGGEFVEVTTKVPHQSTRVKITIDVEPQPSESEPEPREEFISDDRKAIPPSSATGGGMGIEEGGGSPTETTESGGRTKRVMVEMRVPKDPQKGFAAGMGMSRDVAMKAAGFQIDHDFTPVSVPSPSGGMGANEDSMIVRGEIEESKIGELESHPDVIKVWSDSKIAPFDAAVDMEIRPIRLRKEGFGICPLPPCDCEPGEAKGTISDVADYLGVSDIWAEGFKGEGIVVGVVDSGLTAKKRLRDGGRIPNVIGGSKSDWGKITRWMGHGNMCATDVLGMAPEAKLYDLRISDGELLSEALEAFDWAIRQHKEDGTPQILTNSWGIFQEEQGPDYARNPDHPFTRKVIEALDQGMIVLFAAGNCGSNCPDERCGSDTGPGKSILGANGHPRVMTVGAANLRGQFIGYSSQGPAALDANKPDFCSISHFEGFTDSDSGTSAACPIAAGAVALLKQADSSLTQSRIKKALRDTAKSIGGSGWNKHAGAGIIRVKKAFDLLVRADTGTRPTGEGDDDEGLDETEGKSSYDEPEPDNKRAKK
jgi:subtilisin family serine protease